MTKKHKKTKLGLTVSVPLFFDNDEQIDFMTLDRYLSDVCRNKNIAAIYSMAYNTRYRMLNDDEVYAVNEFIVEKCQASHIDVYIGHPYSFNTKSLGHYFEKIANLQIAGVSMLYPERYFGDDDVIIDFLKLPNNFGLNTVLHEMKLISGFNGELINWPKGLLKKVFEQTDIIAVKEDSKDDVLAKYVLELCKQHQVAFVLAGGGKRRAQNFIKLGVTTWLNGSTMFAPSLIDLVYDKFTSQDLNFIDQYMEEIEDPFFLIVQRYGWHLAHKAALEYFGYGERSERFPHPTMSEQNYIACQEQFKLISKAINQINPDDNIS